MLNVEEKLENFEFWNMLSEYEKDTIREGMIFQKCEKGQIIHSYCDKCIGIILILKGEIRTFLLSEEGREITLFRLYENDSCVLSASCVIKEITFETNMVTEDDCEILVIGSNIVSKLMNENIYFRCFVYETATEGFSSAMKSMQSILFNKFEQRLARFLIDEVERIGNFDIHMTHEQIAQYTSSAREVVARMLKKFVDEGYVELKRCLIRVSDIEGLKSLL